MRARQIVASMTFLAVACGCAATPTSTPGMAPAEPPVAEPVATARTEVRLQVGESAPLEDAGFQVTFDAVEGDSRCAKGETCVWEGSATVRLSVTGAAGRRSFALQTSRRAGPDVAAYGDWAIRIVALEPVPIQGREAAPSAYVVTLRVERGAGDPATLP